MRIGDISTREVIQCSRGELTLLGRVISRERFQEGQQPG